jgi:outer membrane protein OmpA-like peptidoglycan-associated protein
VFITKRQSLSLGVRGLYQQTTVDLDGLYTGSQYVVDRGFSEGIDNGEGLSHVKNNYFTFSAGLHWQKTNNDDEPVAFASVSFYDLNKPDNVFIDGSDALPVTTILSGGFRAYHRGSFSLNPDVLLTHSPERDILNAGAVSRYKLKTKAGKDGAVDLITRYVAGRYGTIGAQFHQHQFSMGISYDFPITQNLANAGALELGIQIHEFKGRKKKQRAKVAAKPDSKKLEAPRTPPSSPTLADTVREATLSDHHTTLSARLRNKKDSLIQEALPGQLTHEPLVLEKAVLHFKFEFNSSELDEESRRYFDDLARALLDNDEFRVRLVGHTDNVGSDRYNLRLSLERAKAIKAYLILQGVEEWRIEVDGRGLREPLNDNSSDEKRALNRRVELSILYLE